LMLQSFYCTLNGLEDSELERMGECPYDQVEQFAILLLTLYI
jgi:hypothetical protein